MSRATFAMITTRVTLLASLLTALIFAAGQALAAIPNVEVITFLAFVSGYLLGPLAGALVGGCGMGAHSLFNVMGAVAPPVLGAQVGCYALVGLAGGLVGTAIARRRRPLIAALAAGATGAALVLLYQVVVNVVSFVTFASHVDLRTFVWGGVAFGAVQVVWNAALFGAALPSTLRVLARHRAGGAP